MSDLEIILAGALVIAIAVAVRLYRSGAQSSAALYRAKEHGDDLSRYLGQAQAERTRARNEAHKLRRYLKLALMQLPPTKPLQVEPVDEPMFDFLNDQIIIFRRVDGVATISLTDKSDTAPNERSPL